MKTLIKFLQIQAALLTTIATDGPDGLVAAQQIMAAVAMMGQSAVSNQEAAKALLKFVDDLNENVAMFQKAEAVASGTQS